MLRDVRRWDYLVSPSARYTDIFRGAFGYEGEVLEIGNPRNDILVNDDGTPTEGGPRARWGCGPTTG